MAYNRTLQHFTSPQELATLWATARSYLLNQVVIQDNKLYRCLVNHTSGTFQTDYANSNWVELSSGIVPWISAVYYVANQFVEENDRIYRCVVSHTSTTFAADIGAGRWVEVSSGSGSGAKNYIPNGDFEQNTTTGWKKFDVVLSGSKIPTGAPADGVGDGASITTFAVDSTTPIAGSYDLRVASSGVLAAGDGFISDAFTIDREDQAKPLAFSFAYEAISGTMDFSGTSNNTFAVYIYDASGGSWIQPAGVYNLVQSSGVGIASGTFQTTATGTQYRIAVICVTATSGPVEMRFDSFQLGPQSAVQGAAISDWVSYTPTWSSASNPQPAIGSGSVIGRYRRVGDSYEVQITIQGSSSGTVTTWGTGGYSFSLPAAADTSKVSSLAAGIHVLGQASALKQATGWYSGSITFNGTGNAVSIYGPSATANLWGSASPVAWASNDIISIEFTYPVAGLSSNTVLSQDTDTRVVAARAVSSTAGAWPTSDTVINYGSVSYDTHGSITTGAGWNYRIPVSGYYRVSASHEGSASGATTLILRIRKN